MVVPRGRVEATSVNLDRNLTGFKEEEATRRESHSEGSRGMLISRAVSCDAGRRWETPRWAVDS